MTEESIAYGIPYKQWGRNLATFVLSFAHGSLLVAGVLLTAAMAYQYSAHGAAGLDPRNWATASAAQPVAVAEAAEDAELAVLPVEYRRLVQYIAKRHKVATKGLEQLVRAAVREGAASGIDPVLILAVTSVESGFNPMAESVVGAQGLMQIIPRYHHDKIDGSLGVTALLDPAENIRVGTRILRDYLKLHGGMELALQRYGGVSDLSNLSYPNKVLGELDRFRQVMKYGVVRTQIANAAPAADPSPALPAAAEPQAAGG